MILVPKCYPISTLKIERMGRWCFLFSKKYCGYKGKKIEDQHRDGTANPRASQKDSYFVL